MEANKSEKHTADKSKKPKKFTILVIPEGSSKVKRFNIARNTLLALSISAILFVLAFSLLVLDYIVIKNTKLNIVAKRGDIVILEQQIVSAKNQMQSSLEKANLIFLELADTVQEKAREIEFLESEYNRLMPLVQQQESLASTYRDILRERNWKDRLRDWSEAIFLGLIASVLFFMIMRQIRRGDVVKENRELHKALQKQFRDMSE